MDNENADAQKRKRRRRLPPDTVVAIRRLLGEFGDDEITPKYTIVQLAEMFQLPYFTVYSLKRNYNYKDAGGPVEMERKRPLVTPERAAKIRALRAKGASIERLVVASKLSETTIKRILRSAQEDGE